MRVRHNDRVWVIKKTLQDFRQLSERVTKEYPNLELPEVAASSDEKDLGSATGRKQRQLEDYFKVLCS